MLEWPAVFRARRTTGRSGAICARAWSSITFFSDETLRTAGVADETLRDPAYVKASPVLDGFDRFDAAFFGYSPREAALMDPQHRLLLEVAWEAFEDSGIRPGPAIPTGVFAGAGGVVTSYLLHRLTFSAELPGQTGSLAHLGNDKDFIATRVSYKLDLRGPSLTVQTACSTSLVAVHLACQSILAGECDLALAGAATVRVPHHAGYVSRKGDILAPDGHCRAFDAEAQGTIFGSGAGLVLLKSLRAALGDGDPIYAVIRSTAVNNDGGGKTSYTASSVGGQSRAMVEALAQADVPVETIAYVECHGTGTVVGDPLEIEALSRAFRTGTDRRGFCAIGSVKTNIGHLEQAAGIASLIKTALALRHGEIPPSLNFRNPNPKIDFASSPFFVNTVRRPWTDAPQPRRAAVNSLGLGGTNAFAVLEAAPCDEKRAVADPDAVHLLPFSARSATGLQALQAQHLATSTEEAPAVADVACTLAFGRRHFPVRRGVVAATLEELRQAIAEPDAPAQAEGERRLFFLFTGQGAQHSGMAASLYRREPVFRAAIDRCSDLLRGTLPLSLTEVLFADTTGALDQTAYTQPALFALQTGLCALWRSWGIVPDGVLGHSIGEFAASVAAETLALDDALRLVAARGRMMQALPPGGMAAVMADAEAVADILDGTGREDIAIAAVNGPGATVVSGAHEAIAAAVAAAHARGWRTQALPVSHAFHSPLMRPAAEALGAAASAIIAARPAIPFVSTVSGTVRAQPLDAAYWRAHALGRVRFMEAVRSAAAAGATHFVEIGPGGTLQTLGRLCVADDARVWLGSLDRRRGDERQMLTSLARLWEAGWEPDWEGVLSSRPGRRVSLPTTPFESRRHWLDGDSTAPESGLAWRRIPTAAREILFEARLGPARQAFLGDHRIYGGAVLPTTLGLTALASAARAHFQADAVTIESLQYSKALFLPEEGAATVQCVLNPIDADTAEVRLASGPNGDTFQTHMAGLARRATVDSPADGAIGRIRERCGVAIAVERFYSAVDALGLNYGPAFRNIASLARNGTELLARVRLPDHVEALEGAPLHPALLDACLHSYPALVPEYGDLNEPTADARGTFLPVGVERSCVSGVPARAVWVHAVRRPPSPEAGSITVDLAIYDGDGGWLGGIEGLSLRRVSAASIRPGDALDCLYRLRWQACPQLLQPHPGPEARAEGWLILADRSGIAAALAGLLQDRGFACRTLFSEAGFAEDPAGRFDALVTEASGNPGFALRGVVDLWPLDMEEPALRAPEIAEAQRATLGTALGLINAVAAIREQGGAAPRVWLVTRMAVAAQKGDPLPGLAQAPLWGLGRTAAIEQPAIWGGLVDLGQEDPAVAAERLLAELLSGGDEDQVALREGARLAPRLIRLEPPEPPPRPINPEASYLITGGTGFLGRELACWLAERHGVRHLYLASRRGADDPAAQGLAATLERLGAAPVLLKVDVADDASVLGLIAGITKNAPPLRGVFHCAGVLEDGLLPHLRWPEVARVLAPKVAGAWLLHAATRDLGLDHFVMFSSILSLTGSAGQANYTAANAFLDALAQRRRAEGLPALALNWGPWDEGGIATRSGDKGRAIWRARGTEYISPATGWRIFDRLIGGPLDAAAVTLTDWPAFLRQFVKPPPLYEALREEATARPPRSPGGGEAILARLRDSAGTERRSLLAAFIAGEAQQTLGLAEPVDTARPLRDYGLDSLMSLTLLHRLEAALGTRIQTATMIAGPSADTLARIIEPDAADPVVTEMISVPTQPAGGRWLLTVAPRASPRLRLFCFPFAGGGSAIFQSWGESIDATIEVIAVEPPGRLGRIAEAPVTDIGAFVEGVVPELRERTDRPFAFYGHCLGGLTSFEVARRLRQDGGPSPVHLFVSGARSPDHTGDRGTFEERLMSDLLRLDGFRLHLPPFQQPDNVFGEIIRRFNIPASEEMLAHPELRELLLPAIRAEFQMVSNYRFRREHAWDVPITCFAAKGDPYVSRRHALGWGRFTNQRFQLFVREGAHFAVVDDRSFLHATMNRELL